MTIFWKRGEREQSSICRRQVKCTEWETNRSLNVKALKECSGWVLTTVLPIFLVFLACCVNFVSGKHVSEDWVRHVRELSEGFFQVHSTNISETNTSKLPYLQMSGRRLIFSRLHETFPCEIWNVIWSLDGAARNKQNWVSKGPRKWPICSQSQKNGWHRRCSEVNSIQSSHWPANHWPPWANCHKSSFLIHILNIYFILTGQNTLSRVIHNAEVYLGSLRFTQEAAEAFRVKELVHTRAINWVIRVHHFESASLMQKPSTSAGCITAKLTLFSQSVESSSVTMSAYFLSWLKGRLNKSFVQTESRLLHALFETELGWPGESQACPFWMLTSKQPEIQ